MRIDIMFEEKRLAIEYDGYQHYTYPNVFHKTRDDYDKVRRLDRLKNKACEKKGIRLIRFREDELKEHKWSKRYIYKKVEIWKDR